MAFNLDAILIPIKGVDEFSKVLAGVGNKTQRAGKRMTETGKRMTLGLTLPILGLGVAASKMSMDFNAAMANVGTLIPGQTERLLELKGTVQDISKATGKFTGDTSAGLFQVISAYGDSADTAKLLEINTRAAVAGISSVSDAINLTSAVTKAFGDTSAVSTQRVIDMAFVANKLGQTTFPELAGALPRVTGLSKALNVSMEEMFGVMATATGVTGDTAAVSTQLAGILGALAKPTKDMEIALSKLGFATGQDLIKAKGLHGGLAALRDITEQYGVPLGKVLGRKEALILTLSLLGEQADKYTMSVDAMANATGAADEAFVQQTEGINKAGFAFQKLLVKGQVMAQVWGDKLAPTLERVFGVLDIVITKFTNMGPTMQNIILLSLGLVAALGPAVIILGAIVSAIGTLTALFAAPAFIAAMSFIGSGLAAGFAAAVGPIGLIVAAVLIWANVFRLIAKHWDNIVDAFTDFDLFVKTMKIFLGDIFGPVAKFLGFGGGAPEGASALGADAANAGAVAAAGGVARSDVLVRVESDRPGVRADVLSGPVNLEQDVGLMSVGE